MKKARKLIGDKFFRFRITLILVITMLLDEGVAALYETSDDMFPTSTSTADKRQKRGARAAFHSEKKNIM